MVQMLGRKWPTPVARPMMPFFIAGGFVFWGVNAFAGLVASTMYKDDPRNPAVRDRKPEPAH